MIEVIFEALLAWLIRALRGSLALALLLTLGCASASRGEAEGEGGEEAKYRKFMDSFSSQEAPSRDEGEGEGEGSGNAEAIRLLSVAQANCSEVITCFSLFSASGGKFPTEDSARRCEAARQACDAGLALAEKIRSLPGGAE